MFNQSNQTSQRELRWNAKSKQYKKSQGKKTTTKKPAGKKEKMETQHTDNDRRKQMDLNIQERKCQGINQKLKQQRNCIPAYPVQGWVHPGGRYANYT